MRRMTLRNKQGKAAEALHDSLWDFNLFFMSYVRLQALRFLDISVCHFLCLQIINFTYLPN